jgi:hypothetical protein
MFLRGDCLLERHFAAYQNASEQNHNSRSKPMTGIYWWMSAKLAQRSKTLIHRGCWSACIEKQVIVGIGISTMGLGRMAPIGQRTQSLQKYSAWKDVSSPCPNPALAFLFFDGVKRMTIENKRAHAWLTIKIYHNMLSIYYIPYHI